MIVIVIINVSVIVSLALSHWYYHCVHIYIAYLLVSYMLRNSNLKASLVGSKLIKLT